MAREALSGIREVDRPAKGMLDLLRRQFGSESLKIALDQLEAQEQVARVSVRGKVALSAKPAEGVEMFEAQYTEAVAALTAFGIETTGVPSLEQAMGNLSLNKLRSVTHLR